MADLLLFQSFPIAQAWVWGGDTFTLALVSNMNWTNQNGGVHLAGNVRLEDISEPAQLCPGTILGRVATVQDFMVEPTLLSIDESGNVRITGLLFDENSLFVGILFQSWVIPSTPSPMTWSDFTRYNHLCRKSIGASAMDTIRGWFNSINLISAEDLARLDTARGTAQLAVDDDAGLSQVVVPCVLVTADSLITAWSMDDNVSGALRTPERTIGQDFTIRSNVVGDAGLVGWRVSEPF